MNQTTLTPEEQTKAQALHKEYEDETGIAWNFGNNSDYNKWLEKKLFDYEHRIDFWKESNNSNYENWKKVCYERFSPELVKEKFIEFLKLKTFKRQDDIDTLADQFINSIKR